MVKNRSIDHIIETETDLKAACLLKDAIKRSPTGFLTAKSFADWQKLLGLTVPVLRFLCREGYHRGKLVNPHLLTRLREKFYHVMRTGLPYQGKGVNLLSPDEILFNSVESKSGQEAPEEEEVGTGDEYEDEVLDSGSEGS